MAIGFEDGARKPETAVIGRRGYLSWTVRVRGIPSHSSQIFRDQVGYGAVFELARILDQFRAELSGEAHLTFNPGLVVGGTQIERRPHDPRASVFGKDNVVAENAEVSGDLRALSPEQADSAGRRMRAIVARSLPGTRSAIEFEEGYPPLAPPTSRSSPAASR